MSRRRSTLFGGIGVSLVTVIALADSTGTVSIVGKNVDTTDPHTVGITLFVATTTWTESEPGNRHHFFSTSGGVYVKVAPNLVILRDKDNKTRVGQLNPIEPVTAKAGDTGTGKSDESGIAFTWEVK
jgi:hypothetical protein